jgi:hypothetical protein
MESYEDGDIIEPIGGGTEPENQFSHNGLIMMSMKKCLDIGSKELREGWWDEVIDKNNNIRRKWNEDSRKSFIEAIKTLMMLTEPDWDDKTKSEIIILKEKLISRKNYWLNEEWKWWVSLNPMQKEQMRKEGKSAMQGFFNQKLNFDNFYFEEEVNIYREVFTAINFNAQRLYWYDTEQFGA